MAVAQVQITEEIHDKLGEDGLREVCAHLWAIDCQTCGRSLDGPDRPALYVQDAMVSVHASLHHPACRLPDWDEGERGFYCSQASMLSWIAKLAMPTLGDDTPNRPMLVVNPGMETVQIEAGDGGWKVRLHRAFTDTGLRPADPLQSAGDPLQGATAQVTSSSIAVAFTLLEPYDAPATDAMRKRARELGGITVAITHALNPHTMTYGEMADAAARGQVFTGWAPLEGSPAAHR